MKTQLQEEFSDISDIGAIQYLTFRLDGEAFATEISKVREVLEYTKITRVPRTPGFMRGVINLRGSVVPVIDLRMQFGMPITKRTVDTCIIILEVIIGETLTVIGALADSVQEVIDFQQDQLSETPALGTRIDNQFISAMGEIDDRFVMILDLDVIFTIDPEMFSSFTHSYQDSYETEQEDDVVNNDHDVEKEVVKVATEKTESLTSDAAEQDADIDLDSAIQAHAQWKLTLCAAIKNEEKVTADEISKDDCCVLGKWLHGDAKFKYSDLNSYLDCRKKHKAFHVEAGKVAKHINDKKYIKAEAMLDKDSAYEQASNSVASAIIHLRREIRRQ